ncbi:unnamed protein product [Fusarium graminearum]|uniref:Uncharacterized protein n=1 Tax=Gibberella zeae (strain ATCC MYA-4620 / CBS 123657 / FGSC 9075 / NRRL 31084 / PH-1) TaxID=229533 RepID=A0A098DCT3_GIBZE|nr:unnamed protein product [Fusarium graminearum]
MEGLSDLSDERGPKGRNGVDIQGPSRTRYHQNGAGLLSKWMGLCECDNDRHLTLDQWKPFPSPSTSISTTKISSNTSAHGDVLHTSESQRKANQLRHSLPGPDRTSRSKIRPESETYKEETPTRDLAPNGRVHGDVQISSRNSIIYRRRQPRKAVTIQNTRLN